MRRHDCIIPYLHIMGDLAKIVNLHAIPDDRGLHFGAVNGGSGTDLDIIPYDHIPEMLNLFPSAIGKRGVAEPI